MKNFLMYLLGFSVLAYALLLVLGAVLGEAGFLIAGILAAAGVIALLICLLEKLTVVEQKLDRLLYEKNRESEEN